MRNLVYIEGLNPRYRYPEAKGSLIFEERYLKINQEVSKHYFDQRPPPSLFAALCQ